MALPIYHTKDKSFSLMQTNWASNINPVLDNAMVKGLQLSNISIKTGVNVINHRLSRKQQGWFITDINAAETLFRSVDFNSSTLTLTSSGDCLISLWVY